MSEVPPVLSWLCLHRGTLAGHVTCCWQEVAACPAAGTQTCTLTFGDIIMLPIRSLLSFVRPDELVKGFHLGWWTGSDRASPWARTDMQNSLLFLLDSHASYATQPQHGNSVPPAQTGPGPIHLYPSLSASSSAVSRCANSVAEVKPKLRIPANDRCCGQRCVQFSSLVSGALSPRAPALHIIEFS